jgi:hypothetical protein
MEMVGSIQSPPDEISKAGLRTQAERDAPEAVEDFNAVWLARPKTPVGDTLVEVHVVAQRCVYINNYRVAGSKPYVSEGLPSHNLKTTLDNVLSAFREEDILVALEEKRVTAEYFAAYHARKAALAKSEPKS